MQNNRRGPGNCYTCLANPKAPRCLHRLSQSSAGCVSWTAWPNLSGPMDPGDTPSLSARVSHAWSCPTRLRRSRTTVTAPSRRAWCMAFPWSAPPNLAAGQPPLARHVCRAGPSGCSCRAPPACEHRRRPGQGADIGDRVAVGDEQVGVIPRPAADPCCPRGRPRPRPARSPTPARRRRSPRLQPGKLPRRAAGRAVWWRQFGRLAEHLPGQVAGRCAEYVHQLGAWLHRGQDRGGGDVDPEHQWGVGDGLDMWVAPVPRWRGGLPGGGISSPPRHAAAPSVPARGGSPGANRLGLVRGGRGGGPAGRVGGGMRRWLPGGV